MQSFSSPTANSSNKNARSKAERKPAKRPAVKKNLRTTTSRRTTRKTRGNEKIESEENGSEKENNDEEDEKVTNAKDEPSAYPNNIVVITTYEMIIRDRQHLAKYQWNFIVVDEGHRLKNMDCKCACLMLSCMQTEDNFED